MASRALLLDNRFEDAQKYFDVVVDMYEGWNDPKYDDPQYKDLKRRASRERCTLKRRRTPVLQSF